MPQMSDDDGDLQPGEVRGEDGLLRDESGLVVGLDPDVDPAELERMEQARELARLADRFVEADQARRSARPHPDR